MTKNDQIWPEIGIFGHFGQGIASSFGALLAGWLVVEARGLYLARHLFNLCYPIADGSMELLEYMYLQRGWIIQHKANSWCGFVVTVTSESLDCTAMTLLPYGSISPGRGNGKKLAFFHSFGAPLL